MTIEDFINKTTAVFGESFFEDPFYKACLTEEVELFNRSSRNGIPFSSGMEPEEQVRYLSIRTCVTATSLLKSISPGSVFIFKGVDLTPYIENKEYYLDQLEHKKKHLTE